MTERTIFLRAIEINNPQERQAFLDAACHGNVALRIGVESLLRAHAVSSPILPPASSPRDVVSPTVTEDSRLEAPVIDSNESVTWSMGEAMLNLLQPATREGWLGRLAHYEIESILGSGAFGIVVKAFDEKLHRVVAIKLLNPTLAATSPPRKRFIREARSSAAVRHENLVGIYAVEEEPVPYLVMEYVPGQTLQQRLDEYGPLEISETLEIGKQIALGLAAAHAQGLIHRDIKPANVLLETSPQYRVKITDFGLARAVDDASLTQSGLIAGTPMFMSPEQARGESLDHRTDLFSLGSLLYQVLAGHPAFRASSTVAVLRRVCEDTPRPIRELIPETPQWLCDIVSQMMEKDANARFQSAREIADLFVRCQSELQQHKEITFRRESTDLAPRDTQSNQPTLRDESPAPAHSADCLSSVDQPTVITDSSSSVAAKRPQSHRSGNDGVKRWLFWPGFITTLAVIAVLVVNNFRKPGPSSDSLENSKSTSTVVQSQPDEASKSPSEISNSKSEISDSSPELSKAGSSPLDGETQIRPSEVHDGPLTPTPLTEAQREALNWVAGNGGTVLFGPPDVSSVTEIKEQPVQVHKVDFVNVKFTPETGRFLQAIPRLSIGINFMDCDLTEVSEEQFRRCFQQCQPPLITVYDGKLSLAFMSAVRKSRSIRGVHLNGPGTADEHVQQLEGSTFSELVINPGKLTPAGFRSIATINSLTSLNVFGIDDESVEEIATGLPRLEMLFMSGRNDRPTLSKRGLEAAAKLPNLRHLRFGVSDIDDDALQLIADKRKLEFLDISGARVSDAGVKVLATRLLECRIKWNNGVIEPLPHNKLLADPAFKPEAFTYSPGQPLGPFALAASPKKIDGVQSWAIQQNTNTKPEFFSLSPDGTWLAMKSGSLVRVIDAVTLDTRRTFYAPILGTCGDLFWSPDSTMIAQSASQILPEMDSGTFVWDVRTGQLVGSFRNPWHGCGLRCVAWSPDSQLLSVGSFDNEHVQGAIEVWRLRDKALICKVSPADFQTFEVAFSHDGSRIGIARPGLSGQLVNLSDRRIVQIEHSTVFTSMRSIRWSPDGTKVVVGSRYSGEFQIFDSQSGVSLSKTKLDNPHYQEVRELDWNGSTILVTTPGYAATVDSISGEIRRINAVDQNGQYRLRPGGQIRFVGMNPSGSAVVIRDYEPAGGEFKVVGDRTVGLQADVLLSSSYALDGKQIPVVPVTLNRGRFAFSRDRSVFAEVGLNGEAFVWDATHGQVRFRLKHSSNVMLIDVNHDGSGVATTDEVGQVRVWAVPELGGLPNVTEIADVPELPATNARTIGLANSPRTAIAFAPDGKTLAASTATGLEIWNLSSGLIADAYDIPVGEPGIALCWQPDGKTLLARCSDNRLAVIDIGKSEIARSIPNVMPNGVFLEDGQLYAWRDPAGATCIAEAATGFVEKVVHLDHERWFAVNSEGHFKGTPGVEEELVCILQTTEGQQTLSISDFAAKFGWKNDPSLVRISGEAAPLSIQPTAAVEVTDLIFSLPQMTRSGTPGFDKSAIAAISPVATVETPEAVSGVEKWSIEVPGFNNINWTPEFSPDGSWTVENDFDGNSPLIVRDSSNWSAHRLLMPMNKVGCCARWIGNQHVLFGDCEGCIQIWNIESALMTRRSRVHSGTSAKIITYPTGQLFTTQADFISRDGNIDDTMRVWHSLTGQLLAVYERNQIRATVLSPDTQYAAVARSGELVIVELASGRLVRSIPLMKGTHPLFSWFQTGDRVAVVADDRTVQTWSLLSGKILNASPPIGGSGSIRIPIQTDGLIPISPQDDESVLLFDGNRGNVVRTLKKASTETGVPVWSPDGKRLLIGGYDGGFSTWIKNRSERVEQQPNMYGMENYWYYPHAIWSHDGNSLVGTKASGPESWLIGLRSNDHQWSSDGRFHACGVDGWINSWRIPDSGFNTGFRFDSPTFSGDALHVAILPIEGERQPQIWSVTGKQILRKLPYADVRSVAWSPTASVVAIEDASNILKLCNPEDGSLIREFDITGPEQKTEAFRMSWSPDGKLLALKFFGNFEIWNPETGQRVATLTYPAYEWPASCHRWIDAKTIAIRANDNIVRVINIDQPDQVIRQFQVGTVWRAGEFNRTGTQFIAPRSSGIVDVYSTETGGKLFRMLYLRDNHWIKITPEGHYSGSEGVEELIRYVAQTADGQQTLTAAEFAAKYNWKNDPAKVPQL